MKKINILFWGRADQNYSRNRIIIKLFRELNINIIFFNPFFSIFGYIEANLRGIKKTDLIWVPCFRHRDILSASKFSIKNNIPLIFDPLISLWDKQVNERNKFNKESIKAQNLKKWEKKLLSSCDQIVTDTYLHRNFFKNNFDIPLEKIHVINVGAECQIFKPNPKQYNKESIKILFYGSFLELHGIDIILEAARMLNQEKIVFDLVGDGPLKNYYESKYKDYKNINFYKSMPYKMLPKKINNADIILGVFSASKKAGNVIPNKVFQAMACGKIVITRNSEEYPDEFIKSNCIFLIDPGNPKILADTIKKIIHKNMNLSIEGLKSHSLFLKYFSSDSQKKQLINLLKKTLI